MAHHWASRTAFEREFAEYIGCKHALAVNSATAALQLALDAIGIKRGRRGAVPPTLYCDCGVATYFGARPVLCKLARRFNVDPAVSKSVYTGKTARIIPVQLPVGVELMRFMNIRAYRTGD